MQIHSWLTRTKMHVYCVYFGFGAENVAGEVAVKQATA